MLGKRKKSALEQYQKNAAGEYIYTGKTLSYVDTGKSRKKAMIELGCLTGGMTLCSIGVGLFPAPGTVNTFYVLIPMILEIILSFTCLWAVGQMVTGGDPMKEYVYDASVKPLPGRLTATMVFALLTVLCEIIYLILNGGWGAAVMAVLLLEGAAAGLAQVTKRTISGLEWREKG